MPYNFKGRNIGILFCFFFLDVYITAVNKPTVIAVIKGGSCCFLYFFLLSKKGIIIVRGVGEKALRIRIRVIWS